MRKLLLAFSAAALGVATWVSAQSAPECPAAAECCWAPSCQQGSAPCSPPCATSCPGSCVAPYSAPCPVQCATPFCSPCSQPACSTQRGPCCQPCFKCGFFEVGGEALYWKACAYNEVYAVTFLQQQDVFQPLCPHIHKNRYEWGFRLFAKYYTPDLCNYIGVNWIHHRSRRCRHVCVVSPQSIFSPDFPVPVANSHGFERVRAKTRSRYEAVDLEGGHRLVFCGCGSGNSCDPCCGFTMYLLAGLRYAEIEEKYNTLFQDPVVTAAPAAEPEALAVQLPPDSVFFHHKDRFHGGGPRLGFRFRLPVWCGFGITGRFATSLLVGCKRNSVLVAQSDSEGDTTLLQATRHKPCDGGVCVPQIDAKLGVDYCFTCCLTFKIEAGWAWEHAFHALNHYRLKYVNVAADYDFQNRPYDFGLGGVYIRASTQF